MIWRIWHGWTSLANAEAYEKLLRTEIFPGIRNRNIAGCMDMHLLRRKVGSEVEFVTIMWFTTWDAVRQFAGNDPEVAVVPPEARALLTRYDERSQHYETARDTIL